MAEDTFTSILKNLKSESFYQIVNSHSYKQALKFLADKIRRMAKEAVNEATIETNFDILIFDFIKSVFHEEVMPERERQMPKSSLTRGRLDSKIGGVIIEYKDYGILDSDEKQKDAVAQITKYIDAWSISAKKGQSSLMSLKLC